MEEFLNDIETALEDLGDVSLLIFGFGLAPVLLEKILGGLSPDEPDIVGSSFHPDYRIHKQGPRHKIH